MRNLFFLFVALFFITLGLFAQEKNDDMTLSGISANIGQSSTTSGYDITINFKNSKKSFSVIGNHQRVYLVFGKDYEFGSLSLTGGFFKNCPWVGPRVSLNPFPWLSATAWYATAVGVPEKPQWELHQMLIYHSVSVKVWKLSFSFATNKFFADKTNLLPSIAYRDKINKDWSFVVSADYDTNNKKPLFLFGMNHTIQ